MSADESDWHSHRLLIMDKLNTVHDDLEEVRVEIAKLSSKVSRLHEDVGGLKLKVAFWSAAIATIGTSALHMFLGRFSK